MFEVAEFSIVALFLWSFAYVRAEPTLVRIALVSVATVFVMVFAIYRL